MSTAAETFLARCALECAMEPELGQLAELVRASDGSSLLAVVMGVLPAAMVQLQSPERRAELLRALARAVNRATEATA